MSGLVASQHFDLELSEDGAEFGFGLFVAGGLHSSFDYFDQRLLLGGSC